MNKKTEVAMGLIAILLVLFSAMLDPWVSATLALLLLVAFLGAIRHMGTETDLSSYSAIADHEKVLEKGGSR